MSVRATDDLGAAVGLDRPATRVVSLVPSLTEALVSVRPEAVVGATDWCTHPADLDARGVTRVRGTKNPDLAAIRALAPDLVVANKEENRELDVRRLRESGVAVWVTDIETVPAAVASMERLLAFLGWPAPAWLGRARELWCGPLPPVTRRVVVPVWRDPWMVVGSRTFTGDLLRRLGWHNAFDDHPDRYPHVDLAELDASAADVVLLPDEPYVFGPDDGPEAFSRLPTELVSGRLITWYGPSLVEAAELAPAGDRPRVRAAGSADVDAVLAFWLEAAENDSRPADSADAVRALVARDPEALLLVEDAGRVVATLVVGWDGWRAHLYRLAVHPSQRRRGLGSLLLDHAERRLRALGATRIDAMVLEGNDLGHALWRARGYAPQDDWRRWVKPL